MPPAFRAQHSADTHNMGWQCWYKYIPYLKLYLVREGKVVIPLITWAANIGINKSIP